MSDTPTKLLDGPPPHDEATPAEIRGLIDFLNSRRTAKRAERFDTPGNAERFLPSCDLDYDAGSLSASDTRRLRRLRDAVMSSVDDPSDAEAWAAVNEVAATVPTHLRIAPGPAVHLKAARKGSADAVIVQVLEQLSAAILTGRWDRLGACARCRRVFYDSTRSRTRRWCSYATCGNRVNVARHRDRSQGS